jgi:4-hydroxybenzoate polyprenyltransferase
MSMSGQARRRWLGGIALGLALLILILGETALKDRLNATGFVLYWATCFVLTLVAVFVAFKDMKDVQRKVGREQKELLEGTLQKIEREARARSRNN